MTSTFTETRSFTRTSAHYIASKVVADLDRLRSYYGHPSTKQILDYDAELVELLAEGCLASVEYGFHKNGKLLVALHYDVRADGTLSDDRAGGVYARANTDGATWFSFLTYSPKWNQLSSGERGRIEGRIPLSRTIGSAPENGDGYWVTDRGYAADGVGTQRRSFRPI